MKFMTWLEGMPEHKTLNLEDVFLLCVFCSKGENIFDAANDNKSAILDEFLTVNIELECTKCTPQQNQLTIDSLLSGGEEAEQQFEITCSEVGEATASLLLKNQDGSEIYRKTFSFRIIGRKQDLKPILDE